MDWNEIAVIEPDGTLDRTISSPLLANPVGLAFLGDELLVANTNGNSVLRVCV